MDKGSDEMYEHVGIDVSKNKLDIGWIRDLRKNKIKTKVFKNQRQHLSALKDWLIKQTGQPPERILITLEPTGIYHEALIYFLYEQGFNLFLANPGKAKQYAKAIGLVHKTDKSDAMMLAHYGLDMNRSGKLSLWQPEPTEARHLKLLLRRLDALEQDLQREQNRLEASEHSDSNARVIQSIRDIISVLEQEIEKLKQEIDDHIDRHPQLRKNRQLLQSITGVGEVLSREMVCLFALKRFTHAKQAAAYLGLIPKLHESGTLKGHVTLSKAGPARFRSKLYMAAVVAGTHNPDIKAQKARLLGQGKHKMQALGAAMRKLVQICFGVLKHQQEYQPQVVN